MKLGNDQLFSMKLRCGHLEHSGGKTCDKITKKTRTTQKRMLIYLEEILAIIQS